MLNLEDIEVERPVRRQDAKVFQSADCIVATSTGVSFASFGTGGRLDAGAPAASCFGGAAKLNGSAGILLIG